MAKFCYWSVATGKHAAMMQTLIKSARAVGVTEDFHIWTDKPIEGAIVHEAGFFDKHLYLFKLRFLKNEVQKLDYDYFVFIDADCYFVRNPGDVTRLCGDKGVFAQMENEITGKNVKRGDWWSAPIPKLIELMQDMGCEKGSKLYNTNAGFWIVRKDTVDEFYDMAMSYWEEGQKRGYKHFTEEPPLAFCGHILGDPENNTLAKTADVWVSDWTGQYAGRLPDGKPWLFEDYLNGEKITVNPAIVHAMRSKDAMVSAALPKKPITDYITTVPVSAPSAPLPIGTQERIPILMIAYGNYPHITLTSIKQIVTLAADPKRLRIMVGMNECCPETVAELRRLHDEGSIEVLIESKQNRNKDPLLRLLIDLVEEPYFAYFDDDSFPTRKGWDSELLSQINVLHPFDVAGMIHVSKRSDFEGLTEFIPKRPWFKTWDLCFKSTDVNLKHSSVFPHGAFWAARADYLREHDFPDRNMIKKCDDMLMGELIVQTKGVMKSMTDCSVKLNTGPRRGNGERPDDGWRGEVVPPPPKPFDGLTIYPTGGMCNRLRNIISAIMLCREKQVPLRVLWERSTQTGMVDFADYWDVPSDVVYHSMSTGEIMKVHNREMDANNVFRVIPKEMRGTFQNHWGLAIVSGETIEVEGLARLTAGLKQNVVPLKSKWQGIVDEFCRANEIQRRIGMHLRSFEFLFGERQPDQTSALIFNFIKLISEKEAYFIATDSKVVQDMMIHTMQDGQGCVWNQIKVDHLQRDVQEDFEHGLVDFYTLARCKKVLGTKGSSMSHLAGILAGDLEWVVGARDCKEWDG